MHVLWWAALLCLLTFPPCTCRVFTLRGSWYFRSSRSTSGSWMLRLFEVSGPISHGNCFMPPTMMRSVTVSKPTHSFWGTSPFKPLTLPWDIQFSLQNLSLYICVSPFLHRKARASKETLVKWTKSKFCHFCRLPSCPKDACKKN